MVTDYRREIDWLRALAVLAVVGFHWEVKGFRGGFVGVDVFFVISGFLIGRIVQSEFASGSFSFLDFYARRVRRLVPALYVMVGVVAVAASVILLGAEQKDFTRSVLAVLTFTSNILFWSQSGYFDRAASEKPLLHTWSLGIEEQFYILLPILLWVLLRWRSKIAGRAVILVIALASFAVSYALLTSDRAGAFFLIHSRAWELLLGVMLVWVPALRGLAGHAARIAGIAMIVVATLSYTSASAFPGPYALLPCFGAAIFIWGGPTSLRAPPVEFIGRMSYSLYLWHWPIFTLAKLRSPTLTLSLQEKLLLGVLLLAVSYASYRLIEQPLRKVRAAPKTILQLAAAATTVMLLLFGFALRSGDVNNSSDPKIAKLLAYDKYMGHVVRPPCFMEDWTADNHTDCFTHVAGKRTVLVWGDSLADHYVPGLKAVAGNAFNITQANAVGCLPATSPQITYGICEALQRRVSSFTHEGRDSILIVSVDWVDFEHRFGFEKMMEELRSAIALMEGRVVVMGPSVRFKSRLPALLLRASMRGTPLSATDVVDSASFDLDDKMRAAFAGRSGATYLSPIRVLCPDRACRLMLDDGAPVTWDHGHLTPEGATEVIGKLAPAILGR